MKELILKNHKKILTSCIFLLFLIAGLYYMQDGYFDTISAKTNAFYFCCAVAAVPGVYLLFTYIHENGLRGFLRFPKAAYIVSLFALSYLLSSLGDAHALDGSVGWNVGAYSYLLGLMLFFIFLIGDTDEKVLIVMLAAATIPFYLIAVLQGAGWDVFNLHKELASDERYDYISTAGNITVYSGVASLFIPVICPSLDHSEDFRWQKPVKLLFMADIVLGGTSICLVGSDSAYIGIFGALAVLYIVECRQKTPLWKLSRIAALLSFSFCIAEILQAFNPKTAFPAQKYFSYYVFKFHLAFILFPVLLIFTLVLYKWARKFAFPWIPISLMIVAAVALTEVLSPKGRHFGSGRGEIWPFAIRTFRNAGIRQKLQGVGADCFGYLTGAYINDLPSTDKWFKIANGAFDGVKMQKNILTVGGREVVNCHNEFLQHLLCGGIITAGFWSLSVISVIFSGLRRKHISPFLFGSIGWLIQSMLNNPHNLLLSFAFIFAALTVKDQ